MHRSARAVESVGLRSDGRILRRAFIGFVSAVSLGACGGTAASAPGTVPTQAQAHSAINRLLADTNEMETLTNVFNYRKVTTGAARAAYDYALGQLRSAGRSIVGKPFTLSDLKIVVPCAGSPSPVFIAFARTSIFTEGQSVEPVAMVFSRQAGEWKLATVVKGQSSNWPAVCTSGTKAGPGSPGVAVSRVSPELEGLYNRTWNLSAVTAATTAPFALNVYTNLPSGYSSAVTQDREAGVIDSYSYSPGPYPTYSVPLAGGGAWVIVDVAEAYAGTTVKGILSTDWPGGSPLPSGTPAKVLHRKSASFLEIYSVLDRPSAQGAASVDGFLGFQTASSAS